MQRLGGAVFDVTIRSKTFPAGTGKGTRQVLRDISFAAVTGEILALVGPSGVGKSTVLRIALGLDRDFEGSVELPQDRVGVMFQEPRLLPWLSVADNLRLVQITRAAAIDIPALLQMVELPAVQNLLPSALSLGMARRVALARALAIDPQMLVLDEPFTSLDRGVAAVLGARLAARARQNGTLILLSTHDLDQALATAVRILVLSGNPATLATDVEVPRGPEADRLRRDLLARFPFLGDLGNNMPASADSGVN